MQVSAAREFSKFPTPPIAILHAAILAEEDWNWFTGLVGARFVNHPEIQSAKLNNVLPRHEANRYLPEEWVHTDEWYNYKAVPENVTVLLEVDETSYKGGIHGKSHPIAWCHKYDGGKVFYTAIGHTNECWTNEIFMRHILGGIEYIIDTTNLQENTEQQ